MPPPRVPVVWDAAESNWSDEDVGQRLKGGAALGVTKLVLAGRPCSVAIAARVCGLLRRRGCSIRHLDLSACDLKEGSVEELGAALAVNTSLEELILEDNQAVEERGGLALRRGMDCNLTVIELRVGGCNMTHNTRSQIKRRVDMNVQYVVCRATYCVLHSVCVCVFGLCVWRT